MNKYRSVSFDFLNFEFCVTNIFLLITKNMNKHFINKYYYEFNDLNRRYLSFDSEFC